MRDDPLKNLAIVQAVRDLPELYERDLSNAKRDLDKLWDSVGEKVDMPGRNISVIDSCSEYFSCSITVNKLTVSHFQVLSTFSHSFNHSLTLTPPSPLPGVAARDRWRIIRGSYLRYLKACESETAPKKEYYLARYLDFLRPFLRSRDVANTSGFTYTVEMPTEPITPPRQAARRKSHHKSPPAKRIKGGLIKLRTLEDDLVEELAEDEMEEIEEGPQIVFEEDEDHHNDSAGDSTTYTLRNGIKRESDSGASVIHSVVMSEEQELPVEQPSRVEAEENNPEMLFFRSLLPQMTNWTKKQRTKFKCAVLTAMDDVEDDQ